MKKGSTSVLSLPFDDTREEKLRAMNGTDAEALANYLRAHRAWPEGFGN